MKRLPMGAWALLCGATLFAHGAEKPTEFQWDVWRRIVVLDGGRPKPLDTQAWEGITAIAGRSKIGPTAFATFAPGDVRDWKKFVAALASATSGPAKDIASRVPSDLLASMTKMDLDTDALEKDLARLDLRIDKLVKDFAANSGQEVTRSQFEARTNDLSARETLRKFAEARTKLDAINQAKCDLIRSLNDMLPIAQFVPQEFLPKSQDSKPATTPEICLAHRRYIESAFPDTLVPLTERETPRAGLNFHDRKYDPVELTVTLALTWSGWDNLESLKKAIAAEGLKAADEDPRRLAHIFQTDQLYHSIGNFDVWDATPLLDARFESLAPKALPETKTAVSPRNLAGNEDFLKWVQSAARMKGDDQKKADMTTTDEKGIDLLFSFGNYLWLRTGQTLYLCPDQTSRRRVEFLNQQVEELTKQFSGKSHVEAIAIVGQWKETVSQGPSAEQRSADVNELASRLEKELKVQPSAKYPLAPTAVLEQQSRKIISDIQSNWVNVLDIFARPERLAERGYKPEDAEKLKSMLTSVRTAFLAGDATGFNTASDQFAAMLTKLGSGSDVYPTPTAIDLELHYNAFQPFLWTAVLAGAALVILVGTIGARSSIPHLLGLVPLVAAVAIMGYGMALRIYIAGRPPVTNMYETIIWASFVMSALAIVLGAVYRHRIIVTAAAAVLTPATLLAYIMPPELGSSIDPLVPVLRDNFWLVIHVLTIVASYGAFLLAWILGNIGLGYYLFGAADGRNVKPIALYAYRAVQVGVLLLAAGTGLGGWWAAYSWGRFWGWDPKEVWALIALLGYLAVLHARFAGLVRIQGFLVCCVVAFTGVLMSWYGVNFLLGKGLHAYAFGDGGQAYVFSAVAANLGYVLLVTAVHRARSLGRQPKESPAAAATV